MSQGLEHATPNQLSKFEISPSGFGLYFPMLDADLYWPVGSKKGHQLTVLARPSGFCFNPDASIPATLEHCSGNANICLQVHR